MQVHTEFIDRKLLCIKQFYFSADFLQDVLSSIAYDRQTHGGNLSLQLSQQWKILSLFQIQIRFTFDNTRYISASRIKRHICQLWRKSRRPSLDRKHFQFMRATKIRHGASLIFKGCHIYLLQKPEFILCTQKRESLW